MTCISLITDGIDGITGPPIRVAYLLGRFLIGLGFDVNVVSPYVREDVRRDFEYVDIKVRDLGIKPPLLPGQAGHLSIWLINGVKGLINYGDDCLSINLSFELPIPSTVFYAQATWVIYSGI